MKLPVLDPRRTNLIGPIAFVIVIIAILTAAIVLGSGDSADNKDMTSTYQAR